MGGGGGGRESQEVVVVAAAYWIPGPGTEKDRESTDFAEEVL